MSNFLLRYLKLMAIVLILCAIIFYVVQKPLIIRDFFKRNNFDVFLRLLPLIFTAFTIFFLHFLNIIIRNNKPLKNKPR